MGLAFFRPQRPSALRAALLVVFSLLLGGSFAGAEVAAAGRVTSTDGLPISGAVVTLRRQEVGFERYATTGSDGSFLVGAAAPGRYSLAVSAPGFQVATRTVELGGAPPIRLDVVLQPGTFTESLTVMGTRLAATPETVERLPGSVGFVDRETLEKSHVFGFGEALRKVAGVHVRDEEGFHLRPNIGIRGLNPTRSTKTLLLEDGIPLTYAPYGDNASYYHPPVERYESIEILKGSGQIAFGPVTVGGTINYLTPDPPAKPALSATVAAGDREYFNGYVSGGSTFGSTGVLIAYGRKEGDGSRENTHSELNDLYAKVGTFLSDRQSLTLRANFYGEDSQVTYSGLRQDEWEEDPRQNPFANDAFRGRRYGFSATHGLQLGRGAALTTSAYVSRFARDWWRQSSNSGQRPNDASDPACGGMENLDTTCGNEGRLRRYRTIGLEPRLHFGWRLGALESDAEVGLRAHFEDQDRRQENGETPRARSGRLVEDNERRNDAYSAFVANRFLLGRWTVTAGSRLEHVRYERTNELLGVSGRADLTQLVPGFGVTWAVDGSTTLFAGVHRGFAPPRTEDVISNATGGVVELDAELSWNAEAGVRSLPLPGVGLEATLFQMDYENQIVPASVAGGLGAALTNGGETLHRGAELGLRADSGTVFRSLHNVFGRIAYTWVPTAEFRGVRTSNVPGFSGVSVSGNRLPYAPEHTLTATLGYESPSGWMISVEAVALSEQFADDLNTVAPSADGQRGLLPGSTIWNLVAEVPIPSLRSTLFAAVKNAFDRTSIVDRSRGILPGSPRLVQAGVRVKL
jgi:Fe(3+) dicitrate transport protein